MIALKEDGFRSCIDMLNSESDALIGLVSKYLSIEIVSELLSVQVTHRAAFLVRKISGFRFEKDRLAISGLVQE